MSEIICQYKLSCFSPLPPWGTAFGLDTPFLFTFEMFGNEATKMMYTVRIESNRYIAGMWEEERRILSEDESWLRRLFFSLNDFIIEYYRTFRQLPSTANAYCNGRSYNGVLFSVMEGNQLDWRNHVIFC